MTEFRTPGEIIQQAIANGPIGLSQVSVARRAGISTKHLSQIVNGKIGLSAEIAVKLEPHLGVSAVDLLVAQVMVDVEQARLRKASQRGEP